MARDPDLPVEECPAQLPQHLGIVEAHVAACRAADWQGPTTAHPDLVASLTLMCPPALDPSAPHPSASRLLVVTGDQGPAVARIRQLLTTLPGATSLTLCDYVSLMWSDVIADRTADIGTALLEFLHRMDRDTRAQRSGSSRARERWLASHTASEGRGPRWCCSLSSWRRRASRGRRHLLHRPAAPLRGDDEALMEQVVSE